MEPREFIDKARNHLLARKIFDLREVSGDLRYLPIGDYIPKFYSRVEAQFAESGWRPVEIQESPEGWQLEFPLKPSSDPFAYFSVILTAIDRLLNPPAEVFPGPTAAELEAPIAEEEEEEDAWEAVYPEGRLRYREHRAMERSRQAVEAKKASAPRPLRCEVGTFDFESVYGELGRDFIECHHKKPLSELSREAMTRLEDLALACANCHRMLHRNGLLAIGELKRIVQANGAPR
jgi:hypothetical protein